VLPAKDTYTSQRVDLLFISACQNLGNLHPPVVSLRSEAVQLFVESNLQAQRKFGPRIGRRNSLPALRRQVVGEPIFLWEGGDVQGRNGTAILRRDFKFVNKPLRVPRPTPKFCGEPFRFALFFPGVEPTPFSPRFRNSGGVRDVNTHLSQQTRVGFELS